jgi:hypothetical protein
LRLFFGDICSDIQIVLDMTAYTTGPLADSLYAALIETLADSPAAILIETLEIRMRKPLHQQGKPARSRCGRRKAT